MSEQDGMLATEPYILVKTVLRMLYLQHVAIIIRWMVFLKACMMFQLLQDTVLCWVTLTGMVLMLVWCR
jgi:hypothetical protein